MIEGREKWLAKWRGMSKLHKELDRDVKKTHKESKRISRAERKQRKGDCLLRGNRKEKRILNCTGMKN
jgi:hypothetical protein